MEEKFYDSDFEELIKEKADQYKMYPSDKVWKSIDRSLRSRRKWYWTGFVALLSGISYFAITELITPAAPVTVKKPPTEEQPKAQVTTAQLIPFSTTIKSETAAVTDLGTDSDINSTTDLVFDDRGDLTASIHIPITLSPGINSDEASQKASLLISGLEPLRNHEAYNIELSWPVSDPHETSISPQTDKTTGNTLQKTASADVPEEKQRINWLMDHAAFKPPVNKTNRISWQLSFSPTINYRKLTGSSNSKLLSTTRNIPLSLEVGGDVNNMVFHKPALGFELGTHGHLKLSNRFTFKGGIQFNYSKYDIRAYRVPGEVATIALNSLTGIPSGGGSLISYTDIRNLGGTALEDLKNQYFQLSMPVGFEFRLFGSDRLQFNIASTIQPTYLLNSNTYLITTDFKNYTKEPSLVRKWNVNAGAEAFIAYERGGVKWQVGPQFRYQLLSSYKNVYPIKEYLMEYGIKIGITKTIR